MNYRVDVRVTAPVKTTEVSGRVVRAIEAIFPGAEVTVESDRVVAETHTVDRFAELVRDQRILDTARSHLLNARRGDSIEFALKKQAAFHGTVNFVVGNPAELGDITVRISVEAPSVEEFIDWVAPPTDSEGAPLES